ncbi:PDZ domain-containing protein [Sedimenticola selenatireducens]|uniref:PDZ domain-containing protein n=1 Tax=Sedimenticola selenatireducens TaxID=191960 RepID=UPI002AAB3912|nr:PDZ domain-containing protein [Sedimenticola selenatireducens]
MKQYNYMLGVVGVVTTLLAPYVANADGMIDWSAESSGQRTSSTPNIRKCDDQPGVRMGKKWNWHYPKETPKIRNGNKALLCKSGKKGILYTRSDIEGKYFVTNAKYLKVTPLMDSACAAIKRYCDPQVIEQQPIEVPDYKGDITYQLPSGIYKQSDIQQLATGQMQNKALRAVFERSGWIKNGGVVSMNDLPNKKATVTALAGLLNGDREVMSIMRLDHGGPAQSVLVTWDLATEQLIRMVALPPKVIGTNVVTPDLRTIFADDFRVKGKRSFALFDTRTGKLARVIYKRPATDPVISPDGQYVAALTGEKPAKGQLSNNYWRVWRTSDDKEMASFSSMEACHGHRHLIQRNFTFSPDSSTFYIGWDCGKSTTEDDDYSNGKNYGWLGSTKTWQAARVEEFDDVIGEGSFSADGKLLVTYDKGYDLDSKTQDKFSHCKGGRRKLGKVITGTPLHLYLADSKYEFRTALNNKCHVVTSGPISFNSGYNRGVLLTEDRKRIVSLKMKDNSASIEVFDIDFPDANTLSKVQDSARAGAKRDKAAAEIAAEHDRVSAEAQKLYDAGFVEQAMDLYDEYSQRPDTPPSSIAASAAILWAKKLPLERVGKTLLYSYRKQISQPVKAGDGFTNDDDISLPEGFSVKRVFPGTNAEAAGLRNGDIVLALNGVKVNSGDEYGAILRTHKPGDVIELTVSQDQVRKKLTIALDEALPKAGGVWAVFNLLEYGMVAAAAGHPELTLDAANEAQRVVDKYKSSINGEMIKSFITALKALHMASKGNIDEAYAYAVKEGGFVTGDFKLLSTLYMGSNSYAHFWTPLYRDRKKLAYLLKTEESKLPETPAYTFGNQPYPNLKGQLAKKPSKKKSPPKKPKVTVLDD